MNIRAKDTLNPAYLAGHRDARHSAAEIANEADALAARLAEARGCFDAALFEGWLDALASGDLERIRDLWNRRISVAMSAVTADSATDRRPRHPIECPCVRCHPEHGPK